jgi:hypothetical protein
LDWLPDFDERLIDEALRQKWNEVYWVLNLALWWSVICLVVMFAFDLVLGLCLAAPILAVACWLAIHVRSILVLQSRRRAFLRAPPAIPIENLGQTEQVVNWWQLRKAGFSVIKPQEPNIDRDARLGGKPYLILMHQETRIPVFRKHRGKREVHDQHRARIAGYCHLLESQERARSPFGVILFAGTYEAVLVPNDRRSWSIFREGLLLARRVITDAEQGEWPEPPLHNQCRGCPLGYPRRDGQSPELARGAYTPRRDAQGREYHSICGDRFMWMPLHEVAVEKQLR